jgi:hypothetical protein
MRDRHGNDWRHLSDPLSDERCVEPGCGTRTRPGSVRCWDCHGNPRLGWDLPLSQLTWSRDTLHWCSLLDTRELVLL